MFQLTENDFQKIEEIYEIKLPPEFKRVYASEQLYEKLYNWGDFSEENIAHLKGMMDSPKKNILELLEEVEWLEEWGKEPINKEDMLRQMILDAPQLIPIYGHRYIPESTKETSSVLSVVGLDIIYYSRNLSEYIQSHGESSAYKFLSEYEYVPFWIEMMEQ